MGAQRKRPDQAGSSKRLRVAVCKATRDGPGRQRLLGVYSYALSRHWKSQVYSANSKTIHTWSFTPTTADPRLLVQQRYEISGTRWTFGVKGTL